MSGPGYERQDAPGWLVLACLGGVVVLVLLTLAMVGLGLPVLRGGPVPAIQPAQAPAPRLETRPGQDIAAVRARGEARLSGWGWNGDGHATAHIPIDRAMDLAASQGWAEGEAAP